MGAVRRRSGGGGRRAGAGAKPLTPERLKRQLREFGIEPGDAADPVAAMAERIGLSPREAALRPDLAARFEVIPPGEHLDCFARAMCRYTQLGEVGPEGRGSATRTRWSGFER